MIVIWPRITNSYDKKTEASVHIKTINKVPTIIVSGTITNNTVEELRILIPKAVKSHGEEEPIVWLNSLGGDVNAAIEAGYLFRGYGVHVVIPQNATCESACVYMLAGATARSVRGKVGIHRPYYPTSDIKSVNKQKEQYVSMGKKIRKFFADVNIPVSLFDEMVMIPPRTIKYLSKEDLSRTGLGQDDPYRRLGTRK